MQSCENDTPAVQTSSSITTIPVCYFDGSCYMNSIVFSFESALFALQEHEHLYALAFSESDTLVVQKHA
jgi:hypothetical protein